MNIFRKKNLQIFEKILYQVYFKINQKLKYFIIWKLLNYIKIAKQWKFRKKFNIIFVKINLKILYENRNRTKFNQQ